MSCLACGQKNRLYRRPEQGIHRCGSCRAELPDPFVQPAAQAPPPQQQPERRYETPIQELSRLFGRANANLLLSACQLLTDPERALQTIRRHARENPRIYHQGFDFDLLHRIVRAASCSPHRQQHPLKPSFLENELLRFEEPFLWSFMGSTREAFDLNGDWSDIFDDLDSLYWEQYFGRADDWYLADSKDEPEEQDDECA